MKIAIDAREAFAEKKAGKAQWTAGFLDELERRHGDLTVLADNRCSRADVITFPRGLRWHFSAAKWLKRQNIDFYISPTSFIVPLLLRKSVPFLPVIHDLIAFQRNPHEKKAVLIERLLLKRIIHNAAHICTVSTATKTDLLSEFPRLSPSSVTPIFAGPMREHSSPSEPDNKTILCVGTLCPRKNQERLIHAYAKLSPELRSQFELILVGSSGWEDAETKRLVRVIPGVTWHNYVSDDEYQKFLSTATVFAYPSLYEGFGMQVLDALQRGIPILTSSRGSLKEVAGECAVYVNPENIDSIAAGLELLLTQPDSRNKLSELGPLQAKNYSWKRTVDIFLDTIESCSPTNASA